MHYNTIQSNPMQYNTIRCNTVYVCMPVYVCMYIRMYVCKSVCIYMYMHFICIYEAPTRFANYYQILAVRRAKDAMDHTDCYKQIS